MVELDNIDDHNEHPIITYLVELFVPHVMILESSYPYLLQREIHVGVVTLYASPTMERMREILELTHQES